MSEDMGRYGIRALGSPFIPLTPSVRQGRFDTPTASTSHVVPTGTFLSNNPSEDRRNVIFDGAASKASCMIADTSRPVERPHVEYQDFSTLPEQQDRALHERSINQSANVAVATTVTDEWPTHMIVADRTYTTEFGSNRWLNTRQAVLVGPNSNDRAHGTHVYASPYWNAVGPRQGSDLPAPTWCDAIQDPWSALEARSATGDVDVGHDVNYLRWAEESSNHSTNTYSGIASFMNDTGGTTSASSWMDPVVDQTERCNFSQGIMTVLSKNAEHILCEEDCSNGTESVQQQNTNHFQYRVHEEMPLMEDENSAPVALLGNQWCENDGQYLVAHLPPRSSGSESDTPAEGPNTCLLNVICCMEPDCNAKFHGDYRKGSFNRHRRLYHQPDGAKVYPCDHPSCDRVFKRQDARLKHHRRCHPDLGALEAVPRPRQHETQEQVLRNVSGWTGPMRDGG